MSLKEQVLDIVNEAIEKLHSEGVMYSSIASVLGFSKSAIARWKQRTDVPSLEALEAVCTLTGRTASLHVSEAGASRKPLKRPKNYARQLVYDTAAARLGEFTANELSKEVGASIKSTYDWLQRTRTTSSTVVQIGVRPGYGGAKIWKYVGDSK